MLLPFSLAHRTSCLLHGLERASSLQLNSGPAFHGPSPASAKSRDFLLCCSICVRLRQVAAATEAAWMAKLMLSPKRALLHVQSAVKHVTGAGSAVKGVARALCECQHRRGACWQALAGSVVDVDRCVGVGTRVRRSCTRTRCVELVGASVSGRRVAGGWRASARAIWRRNRHSMEAMSLVQHSECPQMALNRKIARRGPVFVMPMISAPLCVCAPLLRSRFLPRLSRSSPRGGGCAP